MNRTSWYRGPKWWRFGWSRSTNGWGRDVGFVVYFISNDRFEVSFRWRKKRTAH